MRKSSGPRHQAQQRIDFAGQEKVMAMSDGSMGSIAVEVSKGKPGDTEPCSKPPETQRPEQVAAILAALQARKSPAELEAAKLTKPPLWNANGEAIPAVPSDDYYARKADCGKRRYDLLPPEAWSMGLSSDDLDGVVRVLEFGDRKYAAHSWQHVPGAFARYQAANGRHTAALLSQGSGAVDPESGLPARWHALCDTVFVYALAVRAVREGRVTL